MHPPRTARRSVPRPLGAAATGVILAVTLAVAACTPDGGSLAPDDDSPASLVPPTAVGADGNPVELSGGPDLTALPLGDGKYSTTPRDGYVYVCREPDGVGGAAAYGPWIDEQAGTWNLTEKISVDGKVSWPGSITIDAAAGERIITTNDLPTTHTTGTYPIASTDDAYQYDRNPNSIAKQNYAIAVPLNPSVAPQPSCVGGEVGVATTGVMIFSAFDAPGRDAVAVEIQDHCQGHPQESGAYHYHGYSSCFDDPEGVVHSPLLGYAFDGFGIYGLYTDGGIELSSADLDQCHGHAHTVMWEGAMVEMYHYHFTHDFPYTVSCFRGTRTVVAVTGEGGFTGGGQDAPLPPGPDGALPPGSDVKPPGMGPKPGEGPPGAPPQDG